MQRCPNCGSSNTKERPGKIPTTIDCTACKLVFCLTPTGIFANPKQPMMKPDLREKMVAKYKAHGYQV